MQVNEIYFQPPLAIARVGPGRSPMPNFRWVIDRTIHGGHRTAVQPDMTLSVKPSGALMAELPDHIEFREDGKLRPSRRSSSYGRAMSTPKASCRTNLRPPACSKPWAAHSMGCDIG